MPQSLSAVYVHIVFSTKERRPFVKSKELQAELHAYLNGISNQLSCPSLLVGGVEDHVHLLGRQARTIALADWVQKLKTGASLWIKRREPDLANFSWQGGYGAFSVGADGIDRVRAYIRGQAEHHRVMSFQEELRKLLTEHDMEWDERYVWD